MAYTPNSTWVDGSGGGTPITAARLNNMEAGINIGIAAPAARVYHNAAQSTSSAVELALAFNTERFDTDTIHDTVTNNSRLTCKTAGIYLVSASVAFASSGTGIRQVSLRVGGATAIANELRNPSTGFETRITVATLWQFAVNDYVEAVVYQDSGGSLNVAANASYSPEFSMVRVA